MNYLITGFAGQLGYDVAYQLILEGVSPENITVTDMKLPQSLPGALAHSFVSMDLTYKENVDELVKASKPDVIIHCAAWTAVDDAEDEENQEKVVAINVGATKNLAEAAKNCGAKMVYISTDYVFNDQTLTPIDPDSKDFDPINFYGKTKLEGELAVTSTLDKYFIVRISWVFSRHGNNFVDTMLKLAETHDSLNVVSDQIGQPTYTPDLAKLIIRMADTDKYGFYNASNEGPFISWCDYANAIFEIAGVKGIEVNPVTTEQYGISKAARPHNSRLDKSKLVANGFELLPTWEDALERYINGTD